MTRARIVRSRTKHAGNNVQTEVPPERASVHGNAVTGTASGVCDVRAQRTSPLCALSSVSGCDSPVRSGWHPLQNVGLESLVVLLVRAEDGHGLELISKADFLSLKAQLLNLVVQKEIHLVCRLIRLLLLT